jgi:hypothetical protein
MPWNQDRLDYNVKMERDIGRFLEDIRAEFHRARAKHPTTLAMSNALLEEAGELAMALADEPYENVYKEAVQTASTAMRIALEGDRALDEVRAKHGLDALPGAMYSQCNLKIVNDHNVKVLASIDDSGNLTVNVPDDYGVVIERVGELSVIKIVPR